MIKNPVLGKHSHNNRESREGEVFRLIREYRKLSLKDVAKIMNCKAQEIDHLENGRKFYNENDTAKYLDVYGVSRESFSALLAFKILNKQLVNHYFLSLL
jgi:transcriptional regulator with XRE-family HTH domain